MFSHPSTNRSPTITPIVPIGSLPSSPSVTSSSSSDHSPRLPNRVECSPVMVHSISQRSTDCTTSGTEHLNRCPIRASVCRHSSPCHSTRGSPHWWRSGSSILAVVAAVTVALLAATVAESVRVVSLNVPSNVRKGSDLELSCLFDLGNATLYSLKWFYRAHEWDRDEQEFFRYTPKLKPYKQVFPLDGIQVNFDRSGGGTVFIREASGKTSGKYKCEISVDGTFQTVAAEKLMTVFNSNGTTRIPSHLFSTFLYLIIGFIWKYWYFKV